jgi:hypothetical protein
MAYSYATRYLMQLPDATSLLDVFGYQEKVKRQPETKDNAIYRMPVNDRGHKSALCAACPRILVIVKSNVAK